MKKEILIGNYTFIQNSSHKTNNSMGEQNRNHFISMWFSFHIILFQIEKRFKFLIFISGRCKFLIFISGRPNSIRFEPDMSVFY